MHDTAWPRLQQEVLPQATALCHMCLTYDPAGVLVYNLDLFVCLIRLDL
jgi:hypothetical protein